jgi:DHA1 family tetracycline resistance protein-like MFS transporter
MRFIRARPQPALVFVFITLFLDILGIGLVVPVFPKLVEELQIGNLQAAAHSLGWLSALYSIMQFMFSPFVGSLSDRFGRRPVILISLLGSGIDYLVLAWAPTIGWLYLTRAVSGMTAANFTAASAYLADVTPPEKRAAGFGMIGAAAGLGLVMGPAFGGVLASYGLRIPFIVAGGITLLNWLYGAFVLPESLKPEHRRALSWERVHPLKSLSILRRWPLVAWMTSALALCMLAGGVSTYLWVLYTGTRYAWNSTQVGLSLALFGILVSILQGGLTGRIVAVVGNHGAVYLGLLAMAAANFCYGAATAGWMFSLATGLGALGSLSGPMIKSVISQVVPADEQGGVQGALNSITSIADIVAPPLWTLMFSWSIAKEHSLHVPGLAYFVAGAVALFAAALARGAFRRHSGTRELLGPAPRGGVNSSSAAGRRGLPQFSRKNAQGD